MPVVPPTDYPVVMQTPYAMPGHPAPYPLTPVFLPYGREDVFPRLLLNMAQGCLGAAAQQLMEFTRFVDIFGRAQ
jgi:hypothetical protein